MGLEMLAAIGVSALVGWLAGQAGGEAVVERAVEPMPSGPATVTVVDSLLVREDVRVLGDAHVVGQLTLDGVLAPIHGGVSTQAMQLLVTDAACPSGWTAGTDYDGRYLLGEGSAGAARSSGPAMTQGEAARRGGTDHDHGTTAAFAGQQVADHDHSGRQVADHDHAGQQVANHGHGWSGTQLGNHDHGLGNASANHTHGGSGLSASSGGSHSHSYPGGAPADYEPGSDSSVRFTNPGRTGTGGSHSHSISGATSGQSQTHSHGVAVASAGTPAGTVGGGGGHTPDVAAAGVHTPDVDPAGVHTPSGSITVTEPMAGEATQPAPLRTVHVCIYTGVP